MNPYKKNQYKQYLIQYLDKQFGITIKNSRNQFNCPICKKVDTAVIYPNNTTKFYCSHPECNFKGDIFDLIRKTKNSKLTDDDISDFLDHKLDVKIKEDINDLLKFYEKNNFCLFPLESGTKDPKHGFMWTEKNYTNPKIWKDWTDRDYGLGLRLGKEGSKLIAIDIDDDKTYQKMKDLLGEDTLIQVTKRGKHWVFLYEDDFDHITHANLRPKGYDMEVRANNAYIAIAPTSANGEVREWNYKKIQKMPKDLKDFLLNLADKKIKSVDEEIQESIDKNDFGLKSGLKGLDGECNDFMIRFGGVMRKKMDITNTEYVLTNLNKALAEPMDQKSLRGMFYQLRKYKTYDKEELAEEVLERLKVIKEGTAFQIAGSLKREQKDVEDVLKYLEDQGKVIDSGNRKYQTVNVVEWGEPESDINRPVDFEVPYFHDYNYFDWGEMVIIGGCTGTGKTHLVGNIIKNLADQGITPHLINTEPASKILKVTDKLGVPKGKFLIPMENGKPKAIRHPMEVELKDNAVTIVDWLKPKDGNFSEMENTFDHFRHQLEKHKGFLFIMTQLRKSNKQFFAPDLVEFYGSCVAKYLFGNEGRDGVNTHFEITKLRDSKNGLQYQTIPTYFDKDSKVLELRK